MGLASSLIAWASGNAERVAELIEERDALIGRMMNGGKGVRDIISASANGKSFTRDGLMSTSLPPQEKLDIITEALVGLGAITGAAAPVRVTYGRFDSIQR